MSVSTFQCPCACGEPLLTQGSTGDPPALAGGLDFGLLWGHCSSPLGLGACKILFVPSKTGVCFPQYSGSLLIRSHWPSRPDCLGIPSPFVGSPGWETWHGVQNLHNSVRTSLVFLFSSLWVTHLAVTAFDLIVIVPLLPSFWGFFFFGHEVYFFDVSFCWWLFNSWLLFDFGALAGDEHTSFCFTI